MLARFALRNDKVLVFIVVVLAILGVRAYLGTTAGIFPVMTFARVDVVADAGELPPDRVSVAITRPLENVLQALPSVTSVVATSSQGSSELIVSFSASTDAQLALQTVDQALAQARAEVPAATNVVAEAISPNREPIVSYSLTSDALSPAVLRAIATTQIVPKLYGTPGLGRILVNGGPAPEYRVTLEPGRLLAAGLAAADVSKAIADASDVRGVGAVQHGYQTYTILVDSALRDRASLERIGIPLKGGGSVPLASLGSVALGVAPVTNDTSIDGRPAVVINAYVTGNADTVVMADEVRRRVAALTPSLPRNVDVRSFWDQTTLIVASQTALRDAILLGALLAILVIYAFLRNLRLTLVAAAVIPLAMAIALLALQLAGQTLNLMSVGGLAVAVGLIIDDAIVVIEGIARNRHERPAAGTDAAIERTMQQLAVPMMASTATTVVVFLPLAILSGVTGFFFRALAFTLSVSLLVSLGLALFITPIVARTFLRDARERPIGRDPIAFVLRRYDGVLAWALAHRVVVGIASVATLVVTYVLLATLPSDFLPKLDEGQFEIAYTLPVGTSLAASDAATLDMERIVRADPAVASVAGLTGLDSNGVSPTQPSKGALRVRLQPPSQRAGYEDVAARLRDRLTASIPSAVFDFRQILEDLIFDLSGDSAPIELTIHGTDQQTLASVAQRVANKIGSVTGVVDASSGVTFDNPTIRVQPKAAALAALGAAQSDLGDALAAQRQGTVAASLPGLQAVVPVRVVIAGAGGGADGLDAGLPIYVGGGGTSLGSVATATTQRLSSDIVTSNGELVDRVTAGTQGSSLSAITAGLREAIASAQLPPGYTVEIGGQAASQAKSFAEFTNVIALAIVLVFSVMLATFRSFRIPLVVLTAVPLALIGVALGLFVTHTAFNVSSFMGLLLLVGVVVKNGILLIDVANRRRAEGADMRTALLDAGNTRLRPIVMTTLAAIGGLLPLAFGIGQGAEMEKPLAIAVIGGLSTATIFTLVVIPVIYAAFVGGRRARGTNSKLASAATSAVLVALLACAPLAARAQSSTVPSARASAAPSAAPSAGPNTVPSVSSSAVANPAADATSVFSGLPLDTAATSALGSAADVLVARANLAESRANLDAARGALAPSLVENYTQVPQGNPPGPNITSRQLASVVQFTLGDFVAFAPAVRAAALAYAAAQADERSAELAERVAVTSLYYDALKARAIAGAQRDAVALARAQRDAAQLRYHAGDVARLDVVRAEVDLAKAEATLETATASDANASEALGSETGAAAAALVATGPRAPVAAVSVDAAPLDPQRAVALARANRPEISSARFLAAAARAGIASTRAGAFPALTVGGGFLTGTDSGVPINAPTIVANLTLPLGPGQRGKVAAAEARSVAASAKAAGIERRIVADVAAAARTYAAARRANAATLRERDAATIALHATETGYRNGASSSLEVLAARSAYAQAVVDALSAAYDLEKARTTLGIEVGR